MTVADTAPDSAPERAKPRPTTRATIRTTTTARLILVQGPKCTSAKPNGASEIRLAFSAGEIAIRAKAYPAMAPKPIWPKDRIPVFPT